MNQLLPIQKENASALTMSSVEIAQICEKQHSHVLRDIRNMLNELYPNMDSTDLKGIFVIKNVDTGLTTEILLPKRETLILVSGYRLDLRARIIDRLDELENQQNQVAKIPQTYSEALRLAADLADQNQALQIENNQKSEHIESLESYFRGGISPFEFAKGLNGVNSLKVGEFLVGKNWMFQEGNRKRVKSYARDLYLTEQVDEIAKHGKEPFIAYKPVLLKKGAAKLYDWYVKGLLPMKTNWNGEFTQDKAVGL